MYLVSTNLLIPLTNFRNAHYIYAAEPSPSEKYAFVWHMDFPPRKLRVYELSTQRLVSDLKPGVNGEFTWSADDRIVVRYGTGTGRYATILDVMGNELFSSGPSFELFERCNFEIDPSRRVLVSMPISPHSPGQIVLVRTSDGAKRKIGPERMTAQDWSWHDHALRISYVTSTNEDSPSLKFEMRIPEDWLKAKQL